MATKTVTVVLNGKGGELDSLSFTYTGETFTLADVLAAIVKENGSAWTLGDGDTIQVEETYDEAFR